MNETTPTEISLEALVAGDRAKFARLVDVYSSPIYRLGLRILGRLNLDDYLHLKSE